MSKDLKVGSKASGIIGPVGGRFWDSFSWSQRDFAMYLRTFEEQGPGTLEDEGLL